MHGDFRHAFRRIRQQRTFSIAIIAILALGSAAVAVVLAVADAVILRPLPYPDTSRLAVIWETAPEYPISEVAHRNYVDWRRQSKNFQELAVFGSVNWGQRLTGHGDPTTVPAAAVSASFFKVMGVPPQLGRVLLDSDDHPKAAPVVVISHGFWQRLFGGDPQIVGRRLSMGDSGREQSFEIVGVMPRGFEFPRGAEMWIPVTPEIDAASAGIKTDALEARWFGVLFAVGRLRPGATLDSARKELDAINTGIDKISKNATLPRAIVTIPLEQRLLGNTRPALLLLLGAVGLIVLIACGNVATLLLMRASRMQRETAVRLSLGASSRQIGRLWLAEGFALFAIAGVAGLMLANLVLPLVIRIAPESVYRISEARVTLPIVVVVLTMMIVGAIATAGLITALSVLRLHLNDALRDGGSTTTSSRMRTVRRALVTAEVTIACVLLVAAGLTLRSFMNLRSLDLGFVADEVLTLSVKPSVTNRTFYGPLIERLRALPDVIDAGGIDERPLAREGIGNDTRALPDRYAREDISAWRRFALTVNHETATPGYFSVMRIPLRDGRYFTEADLDTAPRVAMISESAAKRLFPGQRAVGRRIAAGGDTPGADGKMPWRTIVGVVSDVRYRGLLDPRFDYYTPYRQNQLLHSPVKDIVIRTRGGALQIIAEVKAEIRRMDPQAVIDDATMMETVVERAVAPWRLHMVLFAVLGVLALAMATVGIYGVAAYAVVERWHELGIRAALGASVRQLTGLIVTEGARLAIVGVIAGVSAAFLLTKFMTAILFGITPTDTTTFVVVIVTLIAIVAAASYIPARLASHADPSELLRSR